MKLSMVFGVGRVPINALLFAISMIGLKRVGFWEGSWRVVETTFGDTHFLQVPTLVARR